MAFQEIPAISLLNRGIVIVHGDAYETLVIDDEVPEALDLIELITEHYPTIYMTDINGLIEGSPQIKLIRALTDFCEVWLDAGVNKSENVYDLFIAGAQEVVLSSKTLEDLFELAQAHELSENLIFEIDYLNGIISPNPQIQNMSPKKVGEEIQDLGISHVVFADLGRVGKNKPLERNIIKSLADLDLDVYVGGGIKLSDSPMLTKLGVSGAIIELTDILKHGKVKF
jgi:uncharacterized protein related to proFAR isomerase